MNVLSYALCLLLAASLLRAEEEKDPQLTGPGLEIGLISESSGITPGKPLTLGLHIHHLPGFHTYWKSPGIVGMATSIEWTLPEGFSASKIRWPYPENTFMAEYPCHGYERDVTLVVTITPPAQIPTKEVTFQAKSAWMCCAKGCFPGFETFELTLPVTAGPKPFPSAKAHLARALNELPSKKHKIKATLHSKADEEIITINFHGPLKSPLDQPYFFSNDGQISSDQKQSFVKEKNGSFTLKIARSEFSPEGKSTVPGVLKVGGRYFEIEAVPAR
ncbi:protein-disulfide reductase DsbD family protein [bacterium]|nr:protein-disulfide reductase DsbD family protein [bacterium]